MYKEFSTAARLVAEQINAHGPGTDDFIAAGLYEQQTLHFLAGGGEAVGTLISSLSQFPLPPPPGRPAMVFLDNRNPGALDWLQDLYPHAVIQSVNGPEGGNALYFAISVPAADRAAPYYVDLTVQDGAGHARTTAVATGVDMTWSRGADGRRRAARASNLAGGLAPSASAVYHIGVEHTAGPAELVRLEVAGRTLDARGADLALIAGRYPFTLSVAVRDPAGVTRLRWSPRAAAPAGGALDADPVITPTMLLAPPWGRMA